MEGFKGGAVNTGTTILVDFPFHDNFDIYILLKENKNLYYKYNVFSKINDMLLYNNNFSINYI